MSTLLLSDLRQNMAKVFGLHELPETCWEELLEHADHYAVYFSGGRRNKFPRNPAFVINGQLMDIFLDSFCGRYYGKFDIGELREFLCH